jgi:hypothetical protein
VAPSALDRLVGHLGETLDSGRPVQSERTGACRPSQLLPLALVDRQRRPGRGELALSLYQHPGLVVHHRVSQPRYVERDRGGAADRRLGDHDPPALDQRRVHEQPGRAQQPVLLLLRHPAGKLHARPGQGLQPRPFRPVPGDHQLPAHHVPHPVPQPQQQVEALVVGEPADREEQRVRRARSGRIRLLHAVADLPDPVPAHSHLLQRLRRGVGHGEEQVPAVHPGHDHPFDVPADSGDRRAEPDRPQVGVHMVHQAEHRAPAPERRQVRHPVADFDDQVGVPEIPQVGEGRAEKLGVGAAVADDTVRPLGHRPAAQQGHPVAAGEHAGRQPVDQDLRSPGPPVGQIPPGDEENVPRPSDRAGRTGQPADLSRPRRGREGAGRGVKPGREGRSRPAGQARIRRLSAWIISHVAAPGQWLTARVRLPVARS